jgi:hypothetical protein
MAATESLASMVSPEWMARLEQQGQRERRAFLVRMAQQDRRARLGLKGRLARRVRIRIRQLWRLLRREWRHWKQRLARQRERQHRPLLAVTLLPPR